MPNIIQAIFLGLIQGITELFPISSLGHSVLIPAVFHWNLNQNNEYFLIFLVVTHFATAVVLFAFFWRDWKRIIIGFFRSIKNKKIAGDTDAMLAWLIIIATIPAGIVGFLLANKIQALLSAGVFVAAILILNGLLLWSAEALRKRPIVKGKYIQTLEKKAGHEDTYSDENITRISWLQAFKVGCMQIIALIPGFSRTGSTLSGSLLVGLDHEDSARFAFLLAAPIILAAAILKIPKLFTLHNPELIKVSLVGGIAAAIAAFVSVKFLSKYFKTKTLMPFAVYCIIAGIIALIVIR